MKSILSFRITAILLLLIANCHLLFADDGHNHSHGNETNNVSEVQKYFSSEAVSDKYELLLRYEPIHIGEPVHLTLFISEYATNKPINKAELKITVQEDSKIVFTAKQTGDGTYAIETTFPEKKKYSLAISISSALGADLILLSNIEAGKSLPHEAAVSEHSTFDHYKNWIFVAIALLVGLGFGMLLQKRNTTKGKSTIAMLLIVVNALLPVQNSIAHEGHDEGSKKTGSNFSNTFNVPKETQFLFDVFTEKVQDGTFTESTKLFGTIIPGSNGQALVNTPQNGKIISLSADVGEKVKAGQQLAVIEQNIDAASQVSLLVEKNNITAEYDAAKKAFERLNSINDIAAKRDVDEAKARWQKAAANLKLFNSNSGKNNYASCTY